MNDFITIGQILKATGIRGEFKVKPLTDDAERYKKLKLVYIGRLAKKNNVDAIRREFRLS